MKLTHIEFIKSAGGVDGTLNDKPSFIMCGRSNVGKSSLINYLLGGKFARVSKTPGRTQLINYFSAKIVSDENTKDFYLVDLPGYGYAVSGKEKVANFSKLLEGYFKSTVVKNIAVAFILLDIRRIPSELDLRMIDLCVRLNIAMKVILTKADEITSSQRKNNASKIAGAIGIGAENIVISSEKKKIGRDEILKIVYNKI